MAGASERRRRRTAPGLTLLGLAALAGCAAMRPAEDRIAEASRVRGDLVLAGRFVASEEIPMLHPMGGGELSHVAEAWRILTFEPAGQPGARIRIATDDIRCPPDPLDRRAYVVALQSGVPVTTLETRVRGVLVSPRSHVVSRFLLTACTPVDEAESTGFVPNQS